MPPEVTWLGGAADKIEDNLIPGFTVELRKVFPRALLVTVYDCFGGYSQNHEEKLVVGVEVRERNAYHTHILKIGNRKKAACDYEGWRKCVLQHNFASRILVSLTKTDLPNGRVGIIYEDAYRFFGSPEEGHGPQTLEAVTFWAILDGKPTATSVERVIRQIYTDLYRWFYRTATHSRTATQRFYRARLRKGIDKWHEQPWRRELRRDLIWLLCSHDPADMSHYVTYLDPYDYVSWALKEDRLPQTLIGRSHGDLHGRNIFVGVQRGESEYPAVFDYGEMDSSNVIVWDFVKLESELKVRLLLPLYQDDACREALFTLGREAGTRAGATTELSGPSAEVDLRTLRLRQLAFAYHFENLLASLTSRLHQIADPETPGPPGGRNITGNRRLDRALCILLRIRQEAALHLGDSQPQRGQRRYWKDEYYFGLAVYGLCTAKFDYKTSEAAFALVSAGVATAQIEMARADIRAMVAARPDLSIIKRRRKHPYPSYRVPLAHAHRVWKGQRTRPQLDKAVQLMGFGVRHFAQAVPLMQEYALLLSEAGDQEQALKMLEPLEDLCKVFRDEETLSRIGRTCKDLGDHALETTPVPINELHGHPAWQWYNTAFEHYLDAFDSTHSYYPGINAATLAFMCGKRETVARLAEETLASCRKQDLSMLTREERFWILVTEGEALLLTANGKEAATFYRQALRNVAAGGHGMVQSSYNQVCRLRWALGESTDKVVEVFRKSGFRLRPGPLCNCGGK